MTTIFNKKNMITIFNKKYDYKQYLTKNMTTIFNKKI